MSRYRDENRPEKRRGAVYTPPRVAAALVRWAVRSAGDVALDPACGVGVFLSAARVRLADLGSVTPRCIGVDIDPVVASQGGTICADFFDWAQTASPVDVVVGNPPFVRSHLFSEQSRKLAFELMRQMGFHPSRLMSTWAPFVAVSCKLLRETGRLALVVPEEMLHVEYAEELRSYLLARFQRVIVCFPETDIFPSVQQSVVLLLCDNETTNGVGLFTLKFRALEEGDFGAAEPAPRRWDQWSKWTHLFLTSNERDLVQEGFHQLSWSPLKRYGRVEVGVVTGANDFFVVSRQIAEQLGERYFAPVITSAKDLSGVRFSAEDLRVLDQAQRPTFLLNTDLALELLPQPLRSHLLEGQNMGIHTHYKCQKRVPWYAVPSVWPADALLLRQAGSVARLVDLEVPCTTTDTIHRVRWSDRLIRRQMAVGFLNTWTLLACELTGRSYGGGVLELMPGEANRLPLPPPSHTLDPLFQQVDIFLRAGDVFSAVDLVDNAVIPAEQIESTSHEARSVLHKLIERRKLKKNGHP